MTLPGFTAEVSLKQGSGGHRGAAPSARWHRDGVSAAAIFTGAQGMSGPYPRKYACYEHCEDDVCVVICAPLQTI